MRAKWLPEKREDHPPMAVEGDRLVAQETRVAVKAVVIVCKMDMGLKVVMTTDNLIMGRAMTETPMCVGLDVPRTGVNEYHRAWRRVASVAGGPAAIL